MFGHRISDLLVLCGLILLTLWVAITSILGALPTGPDGGIVLPWTNPFTRQLTADPDGVVPAPTTSPAPQPTTTEVEVDTDVPAPAPSVSPTPEPTPEEEPSEETPLPEVPAGVGLDADERARMDMAVIMTLAVESYFGAREGIDAMSEDGYTGPYQLRGQDCQHSMATDQAARDSELTHVGYATRAYLLGVDIAFRCGDSATSAGLVGARVPGLVQQAGWNIDTYEHNVPSLPIAASKVHGGPIQHRMAYVTWYAASWNIAAKIRRDGPTEGYQVTTMDERVHTLTIPQQEVIAEALATIDALTPPNPA